MSNISAYFLQREQDTLAPYAFFTADTRGRAKPISPCENRCVTPTSHWPM